MEFVQPLKSRVDIVSVVGEYVELHRSGPGRYLGLCLFHHETSPSFNVHGLHQLYKCFSCGARVSFDEAIQSLSERL
ncbi:MAG TPA: CHC2 zinc finger domain-containing protein [Candidatus Acidoferrum sp.]|nr:CHC2 zinc finger domain-containing protein [Candidatus Acidoferrum sp.]